MDGLQKLTNALSNGTIPDPRPPLRQDWGSQQQQAGRRLHLRAQPKCRCHGNKGRPHNILYGSIELAIPENPMVGPNICGLSAIQAELQAILCKFLGVSFGRQRALIKNLRKAVLQSATWTTGGQKWLDSIDKQKRRSNLKECDKRTDRVNDKKNNRFLARREDNKTQIQPR